jgi:hypothetical protein
MTQEMYMVQRHRDAGVVRQAKLGPCPRHGRKRTKLLAGILIVALCSTIATATLVEYLSGSIQTNITVSSPIILDGDGDWGDGNNHEIVAGNDPLELHVMAINNADKDITGVADIQITLDGSPLNDFAGLTIEWNDNPMTYLNGHALFTQTFPLNPPTHESHYTVKITFDAAVQSGIYNFNLIIRPDGWTP